MRRIVTGQSELSRSVIVAEEVVHAPNERQHGWTAYVWGSDDVVPLPNNEVDDGAETALRSGDIVVQNGTRHAWHNQLHQPCKILFVITGPGEIASFSPE